MQIKRTRKKNKWNNNKADRNQQEVKYHGQIYVCTRVLVVALGYTKRRLLVTTMQEEQKRMYQIKLTAYKNEFVYTGTSGWRCALF